MGLPPLPQQKAIVQQAAQKYGINPNVLWGVFGAETSFGRNTSTSGAGAVGPFQFLPSTARSLGINPNDFQQAAFGAARYLSQYKGRGTQGMIAAYNAGPAGNPNNPETRAYVPRVLQLGKSFGSAASSGAAQTPAAFDQTGFAQAQKNYQLGQILKSAKSPFDIGPKAAISTQNPLLAVLPKTAPQQSDFQQAHDTLTRLAGTSIAPHPGTGKIPAGVVTFAGKPVAAWIAPALQWAKAHGWTGTVTSGYRSFAQQQAIYNSGVRPAAKPGTSNHEMTAFPGGAVDVTNAQQLAQILAGSPYRGQLVWAGAKDPVHFSHPHGGSY